MRKIVLTALMTIMCMSTFATETLPIKGSIISPSDKFVSALPILNVPPGTSLVFRSLRPSKVHR